MEQTMPVTEQDKGIVDQVFAAMHARAEGEKAMMALFAEDASLTEPFSGQPRTHKGKEAIRTWFLQAVGEMPPDMKIKLDRLDMDGGRVKAEWTCTSSVFPTPMRGHDLYTIKGGKIANAEFVVTDMPPME
jgi:ketosteroid isomerase-like protein